MKKRVTKTCKKHGDTLHILEGKNYYRCKECKRARRQQHRKKTKKDLVELFGGACQVCGYNKSHEALQFHHLEHTTKSFGLNRTEYSRAYKILIDEAKKCALLCANCHSEFHAGDLDLTKYKVGYSSG